MEFQFRATRGNGKQVTSRISAHDFAEAQSTLKSRGFRDIELTKVDGLSRRGHDSSSSVAQPSASLPGAVFALMIIVAVIGGIAAYMDMNGSEEEHVELDSDQPQSQPAPSRTTARSIQTSPPPRQEFDADRVRTTLYQGIKGRTLRTESHPTYAGEQLQIWMEITNISIRPSDEVGYEYDAIIAYEIQSGRVRNGNLLNVYSPFPCEVTLHVSENYRVSDYFKMRGNHDRIRDHARLFMDLIEQLR